MNRRRLQTFGAVLGASLLVAAGAARFTLAYAYLDKVSSYHHYLQGSIERKGEVEKIHLQFIRNSQFSASGDKKLWLREWGEKYQGSMMALSEVGLPGQAEKIERLVDKLGRVDSVLRYPQGNIYYLNWLFFPDHPIAAGANWNYKYPLVFDLFGKQVQTNCAMNYTVDKVMVYKKRRAAKIIGTGACHTADATSELQYGFDGKFYFDLDQGREIDYQLNVSWSKADSLKGLKELAKIEIYSILEK